MQWVHISNCIALKRDFSSNGFFVCLFLFLNTHLLERYFGTTEGKSLYVLILSQQSTWLGRFAFYYLLLTNSKLQCKQTHVYSAHVCLDLTDYNPKTLSKLTPDVKVLCPALDSQELSALVLTRSRTIAWACLLHR